MYSVLHASLAQSTQLHPLLHYNLVLHVGQYTRLVNSPILAREYPAQN